MGKLTKRGVKILRKMKSSGNKSAVSVLEFTTRVSSIKTTPKKMGYCVTFLLNDQDVVFDTFKEAFIQLFKLTKETTEGTPAILLEQGTWIEHSGLFGYKVWPLHDAIRHARKQGLLTDSGELL